MWILIGRNQVMSGHLYSLSFLVSAHLLSDNCLLSSQGAGLVCFRFSFLIFFSFRLYSLPCRFLLGIGPIFKTTYIVIN